MKRYEALLGVGVLLVAAVAAPVAALPADRPGGSALQVEENGTTDDQASGSPAPGAQFSAAVEVHQAEVDGEMDDRTFGIRIARAASNDSKAAVVGDRVQSLQDRLAELRDRKARLDEAYGAGDLSEARYRAEAAGIGARLQVLSRQANGTQEASEGLPSEALEARGVDAAAIETIRRDASSMTGPEVAEIARTVGGPDVGGGLGNADRGPPEHVPGRANGDDPGPPITSRTDDGTNTTTIVPGDDGPDHPRGPNRTVGPPERSEGNTPGPGNGPDDPTGSDPPGVGGGASDATDGPPGRDDGGAGVGGNDGGNDNAGGDRGGGNDGPDSGGGNGPLGRLLR